jgi:hypothetical protein
MINLGIPFFGQPATNILVETEKLIERRFATLKIGVAGASLTLQNPR